MVRLDTVVLYSWPSEHRHQTERLLYGVTICGVRGSIFRFMPMRRNFRILAGKVIHARNYHLTGTYRTASAGGSGRNSCLPFMPFLALPPNLTPGTGHHIGWKKRSVFARVPLMDKLRVYGRQIVYAGHQQTHTTYGASASTDAGFDDSLPAMSLFADPPSLSMAAVCHTIWGKRSVFS